MTCLSAAEFFDEGNIPENLVANVNFMQYIFENLEQDRYKALRDYTDFLALVINRHPLLIQVVPEDIIRREAFRLVQLTFGTLLENERHFEQRIRDIIDEYW